jgi:hypothetical protein
MYACRTCQFSEEASSSCVFRNNLYNTVGETAGVTQDVGSDPTVGLPDFCTLCGQNIECPDCQEPPDTTSLLYEVMEDVMLVEELEEYEGEDYEKAGDQSIHPEFEAQHTRSHNPNFADVGILIAATVEQAVPQLS